MAEKAGDKKAPPAADAVGEPSTAPSASANTKSAAGTTKKKRSSSKQPSDSKAAKKKKKDTTAPAVDTTTQTTAAAKSTSVTGKKINSTSSVNSGTTSTGGMTNISDRPLIDQVLYRLTEGIPQTELKAVVREADECEKALLKEIQMLEDALKEERKSPSGSDGAKDAASVPTTTSAASDSTVAVTVILESPLTPLDRAFTLSSLLGRLRDDLALPSIRKPLPVAVAVAAASKKKKANANPAPTYPQLVALADHSNYTREHTSAPIVSATPIGGPVVAPTAEQHAAQLLHVWRKIASHRTAMVFRRPVKPEEAPGYTDRILFPMDLSLVRKMIVSRILTSYSEVHQRMRLISHNCVKYNGRESDYGIVAREFEAIVDEYITTAVYQSQQQVQGAQPTGSGRSSPKTVGSGRSTPRAGSGRSSPSNTQLASAPSASSIATAANAAVTVLANSKTVTGTAGPKKNP